MDQQNQDYGDYRTRKRSPEGGQGRVGMEPGAQQPVQQRETGPQRQMQTTPPPPKKSKLKKALPYIVGIGGTGGTIGALLSFIL